MDNLLKVALDVLQDDADEHTLVKKGLGLVENDVFLWYQLLQTLYLMKTRKG